MPTYEYVCRECGHKFEEFHSMSSEPVKKCPRCKKSAVKRLISGGVGIIFKGSGFYATDYKKKTGSKETTKSQSSSKGCSSCAPSSKGCSSCKK